MSYINSLNICTAINTASALTVIAGPINIEHFDKFCIQYQNNNTAISFIGLEVQFSINSCGSPADSAPNWFSANTTTIPCPSALAKSGTVITPYIENVWKWLRILGATCQTAAAGTAIITLGGFRRIH